MKIYHNTFFRSRTENKSIMFTNRNFEGLFQNYFGFFKNGHKKMSKIKNPKYFLKNIYD